MIVNKGFYLLRSPLMPVDFVTRILQLPHAALADELKSVFSLPYLAEAIYIASPELSSELRKWQQGHALHEKDTQKLVLSLFRYVLRMSTRCTPYGLFAGCATGTIGTRSDIHIQTTDQHTKHCRLDMNYVAELASAIEALPAMQDHLLYFPNNSLYRTGDTYRYAAFTVKDKFRQYDLTAVNHSTYLEAVLDRAATGATRQTLYTHITDAEIDQEEAQDFIQELINAQLLVSDLSPTITGDEFFHVLCETLRPIESMNDIYQVLISIRQLLQLPEAGIEKYLQTHALVKQLLPNTTNKDLIQTDLFLATTINTISRHIIDDIKDQMTTLWKLSAVNKHPDLQQFSKNFSQRYEEQEIPLAIALDTETGIGYGAYTSHYAAFAPLLEEITAGNTANSDTIPWNNMRQFQLRRYIDCLQQQYMELELTEDDINSLASPDEAPVPDSFYLMGSIIADNATAVDNGNYLFDFSSCGGPSAANLLGRFCHGDQQLKTLVRDCLDEEAQCRPDVIFAEIIHLPEARTGNILLRPQLRDYEITYLGIGSVAAERQIPVTDLLVSVQQDKIILRSKKFNKQVIPRLSTAHNFTTGSLPIYKFLCDLQFQQLKHATGWQWQLPIDAPFLPRVRYRQFVLQKATWVIHSKDYPALKRNDSLEVYVTAFKAIRAALRLPRYISIAERDNELFIDLDNETCIYLLVTTLLKKTQLTLQEVLQTPERCWVEGDAGRFTNEVIIPFSHVTQQSVDVIPPGHHTVPQRHFPPGSEWLYVKIYTGINTAEKVLKTVLLPLVQDLLAGDIIDQWFFIRYTDPDDHLRVRFHHATNKDFWKTVLSELNTRLATAIAPGLIHRVQTDTYTREIERYGAATMALSELVFWYDSEAVAGCLDLLEGEEGEQYRWLLAIRGVDMLLQDFDYSLVQRAAWMKRLQQHFFQEFGGSQPLQQQLNNTYRKQMRQISSFLDPQRDVHNAIEDAVLLFEKRSSRIRAAISDIPFSLRDNLLSSYIHMFLNRMLSSNQRKHELVIYHFLSKYYDSMVAMQKQQQLT
ncbi:lantibiotic dehydratase [Chitinophaga rhizophila]|uniref:Lantibiotic dehydratase n=1 Tax=Chitinophaga rhizophila TaxID=2866212 RepID=A0ABS7G9W8_9BACT|nr:lantibiotic dehydratase [Chitinophaga rhizophila]MBW8684461.1 lantibiotic dehydratase [Chitinophaga rhizophila]